ncbi:MAG: hypothetical protein K9K67_02060 [Bacteriovoracaceae bacterium]|nr:hypothetical protein [Bacteriovoracaceae bacterium]
MNKLILIIIFTITNISASVPTVEGLFRNGNNADVLTNLIMIKMMVENDVSEMLMAKESSKVSAELEKQALEEKTKKPLYVKFLLSAEPEDRVQLIQITYTDGKMDDNQVADVRYFSNLKEKILKSPSNLALFYSVLSSLALNRSNEMSEFLKRNSKVYKDNRELIDPEKRALYDKYKRYLSVVKEDSSLKDTMDNPFRPEDPEVLKVVNAIKNRPFMMKDQNVSLVKTQNGFFWTVKLDVMEAVFSNKDYRLEKLKYGPFEKTLIFNFDDYILFDGTHELPKNIKISSEENTVKLRMLSLSHLTLKNKSMALRYGEYRDALKDNVKKDEGLNLFLLQ